MITVTVLAILPFIRHLQGTLGEYHPLRLALPSLSLFNFSVFSKMTFGALCGLEYAAIFSGESRNPSRHFPRAILIAVPIVAFLYIFGTSAILAFVSPDSVDLIGPIPQALQIGFAGLAAAKIIVPIAILLLLTNYRASFSLNFAANTRLPMVAGWDHLLPTWFTRLHPKFRTPVNSIAFLALITLFASLAVLIGVHEQEAFEMLQIWGFTFYGLAYLALFAIPFLARKNSLLRGTASLKIAGISGFALTLLFVVLSIFPIIDVSNRLAYSLKTFSVILGANILALVLFFCSTPSPPSYFVVTIRAVVIELWPNSGRLVPGKTMPSPAREAPHVAFAVLLGPGISQIHRPGRESPRSVWGGLCQ